MFCLEPHQIPFEFQQTLHAIQEHAVGNTSLIEGQTANILTVRRGFLVRCTTSLLEFKKYLTSLMAETKCASYQPQNFKFFRNHDISKK